MTTREHFTDEEWAQVQVLPALVMVTAGRLDGHRMPSLHELTAAASAMNDGLRRHPDNAVLQALVATSLDRGTGSLEAEPSIGPARGNDPLELPMRTIAASVAVLRTRLTAGELAEIGDVLVGAARAVVEPAGGAPLGTGSQAVSERQETFLGWLASAFSGR